MNFVEALKIVLEAQYGQLNPAVYDVILDALANSPNISIFSDDFAAMVMDIISDHYCYIPEEEDDEEEYFLMCK